MQIGGINMLAAKINGVTKLVSVNNRNIFVAVSNGFATSTASTRGEDCSDLEFDRFINSQSSETEDFEMIVSTNSCDDVGGFTLKASISGLDDVISTNAQPGEEVQFAFPLIG